MKQFVEIITIDLFVGIYFTTKDNIVATCALIAALILQIVFEYLKYRRVEKKTQIIFWVVIVFGGATLVFRNETFIQWKPTVVNWFFAAALLVSHFFGKQNLLERMLGGQIRLPGEVWRNLSYGWALGFVFAGVLNIIVAYNFSLDFWVTYKLVGGFSLTLFYIIVTITYLARGGYMKDLDGTEDTGQTADSELGTAVREEAPTPADGNGEQLTDDHNR